MKIAEIDWQAFWNALSHQDCAGRDRWVGRWAFADDGARLSMAPALSQSGCYSIVGDGEVSGPRRLRGKDAADRNASQPEGLLEA